MAETAPIRGALAASGRTQVLPSSVALLRGVAGLGGGGSAVWAGAASLAGAGTLLGAAQSVPPPDVGGVAAAVVGELGGLAGIGGLQDAAASLDGAGRLVPGGATTNKGGSNLAGAGTLAAVAQVESPPPLGGVVGAITGALDGLGEIGGAREAAATLAGAGGLASGGATLLLGASNQAGFGTLAGVGTVEPPPPVGGVAGVVVGLLAGDGEVGGERYGLAVLGSEGRATFQGRVKLLGAATLPGVGVCRGIGITRRFFARQFTVDCVTDPTLVRLLTKVLVREVEGASALEKVFDKTIRAVSPAVPSARFAQSLLALVASAHGVGSAARFGRFSRDADATATGSGSFARRAWWFREYTATCAAQTASRRSSAKAIRREVNGAVAQLRRTTKPYAVVTLTEGIYRRSTERERYLTMTTFGDGTMIRQASFRRWDEADALGVIPRSGWRVCAPAAAMTGGTVEVGSGPKVFLLGD